jgi:hypothetical protein
MAMACSAAAELGRSYRGDISIMGSTVARTSRRSRSCCPFRW